MAHGHEIIDQDLQPESSSNHDLSNTWKRADRKAFSLVQAKPGPTTPGSNIAESHAVIKTELPHFLR